MDTVLTTNAGLFAQSNLGGTSAPVCCLGKTQNATAAGTTEPGLYAGIGLSAKVGPNVTLTAGADAEWYFYGQVSRVSDIRHPDHFADGSAAGGPQWNSMPSVVAA